MTKGTKIAQWDWGHSTYRLVDLTGPKTDTTYAIEEKSQDYLGGDKWIEVYDEYAFLNLCNLAKLHTTRITSLEQSFESTVSALKGELQTTKLDKSVAMKANDELREKLTTLHLNFEMMQDTVAERNEEITQLRQQLAQLQEKYDAATGSIDKRTVEYQGEF